MISTAFALWVAGCASTAPTPVATEVTPPTAPADPAPLSLERASGSVVWRALDHLAEGTYSYPTTAEPLPHTDGRFPMARWTDTFRRRGGLREFTTPLPFATAMPRPNYPPMGARLMHGKIEVPYASAVLAPTGVPEATWFVDHGVVRLVSPEEPGSWNPAGELVVEELGTRLRRLQFATAAQEPAAFASTSLEVDRVTRPGLYLPAPASAEFPVVVPTKARLRFGLGLLPDPITGERKGSGVDLAVDLDGTAVWSGHVDAATPWAEVVVELPEALCGRSAKLTFTSAPGADDAGDTLVVTSPQLIDTAAGAPRHVVVVGIDTLRWDALSANGAARATSPELDQWLAQGVQFTHAYSPAPRTKPSFRTAFTGRYASNIRGAPTIAEVLAPLGFATAGVVGNVHLVPRFGFDKGMDHWEYENGARAGDQTDRALAWAKAHQDEDTYLFVHYMDPHTFYDAPAPYKDSFQGGRTRPKPIPARFNRWQIYSLMSRNRLTEEGQKWIRGAYDEEVAYVSHELSRLLTGLDALPGQTFEVIHADHGEEFWDHGQYEHNHTLYDELVHVELTVRPPKGWSGAPKVDVNVGLVDVAATLFDVLGVPADRRPTTDGRSLRDLFDPGRRTESAATAAKLADRPLQVGSLRYGRDRWGVIVGKEKYTLETSTGAEELFDRAEDPVEKHNLVADRKDRLPALRAAMGEATGWSVRPGLRIVVPANVSTTTFTFPDALVDVQVMDPELGEELRANTEWGETPKRTVTDIGTIRISEDHKSFVYNPGIAPVNGTILVQCSKDPCPVGTLTMGRVEAPVGGTAAGANDPYTVWPGPVMIPTDACDLPDDAGGATSTEIDQLTTLGYLRERGEEH